MWTVNVVEVSNHTCWPSVVWAVNMTEEMFAGLATNCTKSTNNTNH